MNLSSQSIPLHELDTQNILAQMVKNMLYSVHVGEYTDQIKSGTVFYIWVSYFKICVCSQINQLIAM